MKKRSPKGKVWSLGNFFLFGILGIILSKTHIGKAVGILQIRSVQLWSELLKLSVTHFPFLENKMIIVILSSLVYVVGIK